MNLLLNLNTFKKAKNSVQDVLEVSHYEGHQSCVNVVRKRSAQLCSASSIPLARKSLSRKNKDLLYVKQVGG